MFQNECEESEYRPGVLRSGYCVKQGNVVSTLLLLSD